MSANNKKVINVDNKDQKGVSTALCKEAMIMRGLSKTKKVELVNGSTQPISG